MINPQNQITSHKDDEQHNVAFRRRNHEKTQRNLIYMKITYLDRNKGKKRYRLVILGIT